MPSAMSRPREPVETVSTSIDLSFLPSRMIEPLPKVRSIWESAASRAFDLSMEEPSTRRNAVVIAPTPYRTGFAGPTTNGQRGSNVHDLFSVRNMFFFTSFENHVVGFAIQCELSHRATDQDAGIRACISTRMKRALPVFQCLTLRRLF